MTDAVRSKRLLVSLTPEEHGRIRSFAELTCLSMSSYLRRVGLGYQPATLLDHERVRDLIRLRGDLGRLGGLLKLWLTEPAVVPVAPRDVRRALDEIEKISDELRDKIRAL